MSDPNPYSSPETAGARASPPGRPAAPCPSCGNTTAQPIKWTIWGGALGPKLFHHVKCVECGANYNSKKGTRNTVGMAIYLTISLTLGVIAGLMLARLIGF